MAEKKLNARVVHKHDIEENWLKATTFVPKAAEIIVYDPDDNYSYSRIKVGDGVTTVIDLPFSAGQADLTQNDPTAPDYIKGRTHWTDDPVTTTETEVIVEEQTFQFTNNMYFEDGVWNLVLGETYTVTWDGTAYECVCFSGTFMGTAAIALGNAALTGSGENTGEPFVVGVVGTQSGFTTTDNESHTVSIAKITSTTTQTVHMLDPKYYERIAWVDGEMVEVLPETTLTCSEDDPGDFTITTPLNLILGERYTVNIDGTEYMGTAVDSASLGADMAGGVLLANDGADFATGEGAVFVLMEFPPEAIAETGAYAGLALMNGGTSVTVSIYQGEQTIHTIDPMFLPNGVPYIIEGESTNTLTFDGNFAGKETIDGMLVKISDNAVSAADLESVTSVDLIGLVDGAPNGTVSEFEIADWTTEGMPMVILGCTYEESELPLLYVVLEDYSANGMTATKGTYFVAQEGQFYVSKVVASRDIFGEPDILNKLDPVLLPDNVPYLIEGEDGEVILEETTGMPDYDGFISAPTFNVIPDKTVIVTWNGTDYECLVHSLEYNGTNFYAFGNSERIYALYGATVESNNAPFTAFAMPDGSTSYVMAEDNSTEVTVSIRYTETPAIIQKLDNRCLDLEWYADKPQADLTEIFPEASVANETYIFTEEIEQIPLGSYGTGTLRVVYDGTIYDTTYKYEATADGIDEYLFAGNLSVLGEAEDTGEPFVIGGFYNNSGVYVAFIAFDEGTHTISISIVNGYTYNTIPKEYLPDLTSEIQETLEPIKNQLKETMLVLTDTVNGYEYIIQMQNGNLISICKCGGITITSLPTKSVYEEGETFDLSGLVVSGVRQDGEVYEIEGWVVEEYDEVATLDNDTFYVSYIENSETFTTSFDLTVNEWDHATHLIDFEYTNNGDGTYTITDWKGTLNGEVSTEMVVPDNSKIII